MNRTLFTTIAATLLLLAACTPAPAPKPAPEPVRSTTGDMRYLVDPRTGYDKALPPALDKRFTEAWQLIGAGDFAGGRRRLDEIAAKESGYLPVRLAEAAIDLLEGRVDAAHSAVERILTRRPYLAADVYDAEIAIAQKRTRRAYDIYRDLAKRPDAPPTAQERATQLGREVFDQLFAQAQAAQGAESIRMLREALAIAPEATAARMLLVQRLVADKQYAEAKRTLDPMLNTQADRAEVQEALAEIDAGNGMYEQAIARYERLTRKSNDARYRARLDQLKEQFAAANMPPQYQRAVESETITRADLAVIMYWDIASIRFAQNLGAPHIATDIGEIPGRDEVIRAIALGIYQVDPVTRRVSPHGAVTNGSLARIAARTLVLRGAPCVKGASSDPTELGKAQKVLAACGIADPSLGSADLPATGRDAARVMEGVDGALK